MSVRAMKHGAVDFLAKPFNDQDMLDAVTAAIERDRQRRAVDGEISEMRERFGPLSPREQQVMLLVTAGKMNKQVWRDLGISEITVKIDRGAASRKLDAGGLADRARRAAGMNQTPVAAGRGLPGPLELRAKRPDAAAPRKVAAGAG